VKENVLSQLQGIGQSLNEIKEAVIEFIGDDKLEFWGYYADYDWVVFCWLFGTMMDLPNNFPMYCKDLKQLADDIGKPKFEEPDGEHNALVDAIWNEELHKYLEPTKVIIIKET